MKSKESQALKLPFQTGEFLCTWSVPDLDEGVREVSGSLNLEVGKYPYGVLHGNVPIKWVNGAASFPQRHNFQSLVGRLSNGGSVALMNGDLNYWFETQGRATGAFAVLSRDYLESREVRKYEAIELQIEGLDALMGRSPISEVSMPQKPGDKPVWAATINREAKGSWEMDGDEMSIWYNASIRALDFYEFRMVFGSVLRITSKEALTIEDWWLEWVRPLRQLVSLITQSPRGVHAFLALRDASDVRSSRDQVFGWDISQDTRNTNRDDIEATKSLVNLSEDEADLLALLKKWQELSAAHHPLLETYGSMTTATEQHPRSRVLLLLQALEGLYGFETSEKRGLDESKYTEKREAILARAQEASLNAEDLKFLKKNLMKRPQGGLFEALSSIFRSQPVDVRIELDETDLFSVLRSKFPELAQEAVERILVKIRNDLSHGSASFEPFDLQAVADLLDRVARAETLRVLGAPDAARVRALEKG